MVRQHVSFETIVALTLEGSRMHLVDGGALQRSALTGPVQISHIANMVVNLFEIAKTSSMTSFSSLENNDFWGGELHYRRLAGCKEEAR